jgi:hypothetical protein
LYSVTLEEAVQGSGVLGVKAVAESRGFTDAAGPHMQHITLAYFKNKVKDPTRNDLQPVHGW